MVKMFQTPIGASSSKPLNDLGFERKTEKVSDSYRSKLF